MQSSSDLMSQSNLQTIPLLNKIFPFVRVMISLNSSCTLGVRICWWIVCVDDADIWIIKPQSPWFNNCRLKACICLRYNGMVFQCSTKVCYNVHMAVVLILNLVSIISIFMLNVDILWLFHSKKTQWNVVDDNQSICNWTKLSAFIF